MRNAGLFTNEGDYPELDAQAAVEHLRRSVSFDTTGYVDTSRVNYAEFDAFQEFLRTAYPAVMKYGSFEKFGHSVLITLPGSDASLSPALFAAHQDVVPATPENWKHPPFSGDLTDGYIWGRGTLDIKQMLIAELESAEYLLSHGKKPRRTIYLAFGEDEETCSKGAKAIEKALEERNVRLEYVFDEGMDYVSDASDWGVTGRYVCPVGMYEKGYADLRLSVSSKGGHSSNPYCGTSLGTLAEAITTVIRNMPPARLSESVIASLEMLRPSMTDESLKAWAEAPCAHEKELTEYLLSKESLYHLALTTAAPTMISGGSPSGNVMPQDMEAVINMRLTPFDTPESLLERFRKLISTDVKLEWAQAISASVPSETDSCGFRSLISVLAHYFGDLIFIPQQSRCATDARWYEPICRCVMRLNPFLEETDIVQEGVHGKDERISVRAYLHGIRVILRMMETTCL